MMKRLLIVMLVVFGVMSLFSWSTDTFATEKLNLVLSTPFAGGDAEGMRMLTDAFNESHDSVQITLAQGTWTEYYAQLYNSVVGGNSPQISIIHTNKLNQMRPA